MAEKTNPRSVSVCVSNLPNETSEAELQALFSQYAAVWKIRLFSGEPYRRSSGFGYLDLSPDDVERVISALDGYMFNGSSLHVSPMSWAGHARQVSGDRSAGDEHHRDDEIPSSLRRPRYEVASVERTAMPAGGEGIDWYRYVLACGAAQITGFHRGTRQEVTAYATNCAEDFNLRSASGKSTRASAFLALRKKK
jgi:hypothetical protein